MKIVIDISKSIIEHLKDGSFGARIEDKAALVDAVMNGKPLPKGHRGIVDLKSVQWALDDAILEDAQRTGQLRTTHNEIASILKAVPKIIEADTESEGEYGKV